ncbi:XF1762 family protein [Streptomyces sp. NPDC059479]|uniref:XF1762 family protein n=1 Tax=Streptomyces sp. NPDC059479 TaxID=3346848 RepID=UPI00368DD190
MTQQAEARLTIIPVSFQQARAFIAAHHRHHGPPQGMKFALGVAADGALVGVAVVGRPVARHLDDGVSAEVTRTCTDGTAHANSKLYGAAWRVARALGYQRMITYTQADESRASLRAVGFRPVAQLAPRGGWSCPAAPAPARPAQSHVHGGNSPVRDTRRQPRRPIRVHGVPERVPEPYSGL